MTPAHTALLLRDAVEDLNMDNPRGQRLEEAVSCTEQCADDLAMLDDATATHAQIARVNDALALIAQLQRVLLDIVDQEASRYPARRPSIEDGMSAAKAYRETYGDDEAA
jgi:hypothetical protein